MANYRGPRAKISRKFGEPIMGCEKVLQRKNYPPGQHGQKRKRKSEYAIQLAEKQKAKYRYGVLERQFRNLVRKASSQKGVSGDLLIQWLEMRLASVVHRMGLCPSNASARQFVVHRHLKVNGQVVDRPSYALKKGDVLSLTDKSKNFSCVQNSLAQGKPSSAWLAWDQEKMTGVVLEVPPRKNIPEEINGNVIIEFYAR